jgi:hypothetical protein
MGAEVLEIFAVDLARDDAEAYERSFEVPPGGAFAQRCTEQAIFYTVLGGAAFVGSILRAWCRGESHPRHVVFDFRHFLLQTEGETTETE